MRKRQGPTPWLRRLHTIEPHGQLSGGDEDEEEEEEEEDDDDGCES